eukprot:6537010-Ditylum_brightwellii.AAC.1
MASLMLKGTKLEALFSGQWKRELQCNKMCPVFLDLNPVCFQSILDYLVETKLYTEDRTPKSPNTDLEYEHILLCMIRYFDIDDPATKQKSEQLYSDELPWEEIDMEGLPDHIKEAMVEEQKVFDIAKQELQGLKHNFEQEEVFIHSLV